MAILRDMVLKIKMLWSRTGDNAVLIITVVLVAFLAFGLGRLSVFYGQKDEFKILYPASDNPPAVQGIGN